MECSRHFFVGGNWKCNGTLESTDKLVDALNNVLIPSNIEVVFAPTSLHIARAQQKLQHKEIKVAAQNAWVKGNGAYTGEISADMLKDAGLEWVILGHSERRSLCGESSQIVADKTVYCLKQGIKVIVCIGETLEQRESGDTSKVVTEQLGAVAQALGTDVSQWKQIVIAYEPVWAIGTGKVATADQAQEVHQTLRSWLSSNTSAEVAQSTRIIYGGSVSAKNCTELASLPDVDGFLVGGASLKPEFADIIKSGSAKDPSTK
ncbi:hypothetical protein WJX84_009300 [Apatococcus fuscideae]|uniref:Triosephosphate isomerase n=1 Tax=Apatococcus fuscideae TaxID=2026836 RepID=A0AAW1SPV2_9CHLO